MDNSKDMSLIMDQLETLLTMTQNITDALDSSTKKTEDLSSSMLSVAGSIKDMAESVKALAEHAVKTTDADPRQEDAKPKTQKSQEQRIEELTQVVRRLAKEKPLRKLKGSVAIDKSDAYEAFERMGYAPHATTKRLAKAKILRSIPEMRKGVEYRSYTPVIKISGKSVRVIVVNGLPEEEST